MAEHWPSISEGLGFNFKYHKGKGGKKKSVYNITQNIKTQLFPFYLVFQVLFK
jgi:hypothetical protein